MSMNERCRIVVAVEDSAAAFAAASVAVDLAARLDCDVVAVSVVSDERRAETLAGRPAPLDRATSLARDMSARQAQAAESALRHVEAMGQARGVRVVARRPVGLVADEILAEAGRQQAELLVIARANHVGGALPYLGGQTQRVVEFAETPTLVVPPPEEPVHGHAPRPRS